MGVFRGECGEFCGTDHALMNFSVAVVSARQFRQWTLTRKIAPAPGPEQPPCEFVPGVRAKRSA